MLTKKLLVIFVLGAMIITVYGMPSAGSGMDRAVTVADKNTAGNAKTYNVGIVLENDRAQVISFLRDSGISFSVDGNLISFYASNSTPHYIYNFINSTGNSYYDIQSQLNFTGYTMVNPLEAQNPFVYYPSDIYYAYDYTWALDHGITGKGETIAIVDAYGDPSINYDINAFDQITGLPPLNLSVIYINKSETSYNSHWAAETSLDVEWAHASAPLARIDLVVAQNSTVGILSGAISFAIENLHPNIISLSWGIAEYGLPMTYVDSMNAIFRNATREGITIVAASGDQGAYDGTKTLTVNFPASSPYVLGVGGTSLFVNNGVYSQSGWGASASSNKSLGSGGGYSQYFGKPYWQDPAGYNSTMRGVPDVSMLANPDTGVLMISQGQAYDAGGTSLAAPLWAGVVALTDQASGKSLGLVNPILYQASNTPFYNYSFDQIYKGYNGYYSAGPGWNPVTGLGTPRVSNLINVTMEITGPYGTVAVSNYHSERVNATISQKNTNDTYNFVSLYNSANNSVKAGIFYNGSSLSYLIIVEENGMIYEKKIHIGKESSYDVGIQEYNSTFNFTLNSSIEMSKKFYLTYVGNVTPAFGTEMIGSYSNLTNVSASFTGIYSGNESITNFTLDQVHFQSINYSRYDSINILNETSSFNASRSYYYQKYLNKKPDKTYIVYNITYALRPEVNLALSNGNSSVFYVNGKMLPVSNFPASPGKEYVVNTTYDGKNISTRITIPEIYSLDLHDSGDVYPSNISAIVNYFYPFYNNSDNISIPVFLGNNNIKIYSEHFYSETNDYSIYGNETQKFFLKPYDGNFTVMVYPSNVSINMSGESLNFSMGYYYGSFAPGNYTLNINATGFYNYSEKLEVMPGTDYQDQVTMKNSTALYEAEGYVSDGLFNFSLQYVRVNDSKYVSYTNSTGFYTIFLNRTSATINYSRPYYKNTSLNYSMNQGKIPDVKMYPAGITITNLFVPVITNVLPFLFSVAYISWKPYTGNYFSEYEIMYSTNPSMSNARTITISSQSTSDLFILGITPGSNYYVQETVRLTTGQYFQSGKILISYSNPVYLLLNIVIVVGILAYAYMAFRTFYRKKVKYD